MPHLYGALAPWWPLLSAPGDYAEEAAFYARLLVDEAAPSARSLLELGSGGGNNASHMKTAFAEVVLVDASPGMLDVSRKLNPDCEHVVGDMRTVRLGRAFDRVFIHDAIDYMASREDLRAALATAYEHCRPGGLAVFAPDYVRETFASSTSHGGHDDGPRGLRYVAWTRDPDPSDTRYTTDYAFLLKDGETVRVAHDRHVGGLFARAEWLELLRDVGFRAEAVPWGHSEVERPLEVFRARRPAEGRGRRGPGGRPGR